MHAVAYVASPPKQEIVLSYRSEVGPTVTHVRGGLVMSTLDYLKSAGHFDQYVEALDPQYRDKVLFALAASWLPVDVMMAHCAAIDRLKPTRAMQQEGGQSVGKQFGTLIYSALVKASKSVGNDFAWTVLKQSGRFMQRVYQGGGCTVIRTGPKDALIEMHGLPMVTSPCFRAAHQVYLGTLFRLTTTASYVKPAVPRERHPHCIATTFSWV
ncbi:MAG: hypothetical protein ABW252_08435 [Polyangiales bacterium]